MKKQSDKIPLLRVTVGKPVAVPDNTGDTWIFAWTQSGRLFSPSNDTSGFHDAGSCNLMFHEIKGEQANSLTGETVNTMPHYRKHGETGPDGCTWKSSGCIAVDGKLYLLVARHTYGETSGDPMRRQTAQNASIIRSADDGKMWYPSAQEITDKPMFPGPHFATPYFINYGQDGAEAVADQSDRYVYGLSNNGFWDNGDTMILGRVLRSRLPDLNGADWQFLTQPDGSNDANWSTRVQEAKPVLRNPGHLGSTGAVYLPAQKCYFMIAWYYPLGGGKMPGAKTETVWDFYTAPHPWGPWKTVGSHTSTPLAFYGPQVCPKFTSKDGSLIWAFAAGNWEDPIAYRLTAIPLTIHA